MILIRRVNKYICLFLIFLLSVTSFQCSTTKENNDDDTIPDNSNNIEDVNTNLTDNEFDGIIDFAPDFETHKLLLTNTRDVKVIVNIYYQIVGILYSDNVDYVELKTLYKDGAISDKVIELDKIYRTSYDRRILNYFRLGAGGIDNIEMRIGTLLLRVMKNALFLEIKKTTVEKEFKDKTSIGSPNHWDKAYEYYKAFIPIIEKAYEYSDEEDIRVEFFEDHFLNGAYYVYNKDEESRQALCIESNRLKNKIIKALFLNTIKHIELIEKEKSKPKIDYKKVSQNVIYATGYFKILSDTMDNENIKLFIIREINKTFTIKKDIVLINAILYLFHSKSYTLLSRISREFYSLSNDELTDIVWNAYFYYSIFNFDYETRIGEEKTKKLKTLWASLIKSVQEKNYEKSIGLARNIIEYLMEYKITVENILNQE
jgi:hypothetical protein